MKHGMSADGLPVLDPTMKPSPLSLGAFDKLYAPLVAGWVQGAEALFRLAPGTPPPLTAAKVVGWTSTGGCPWLLWAVGQQEPCGYAELNPMESNPEALWMGHLLLRSDVRGQGWGHRFVRCLVDQAFDQMAASAIVLVVFPDNQPAIRCYERAGFSVQRKEVHRFRSRQRHRMLRMELVNPNPITGTRAGTDRVAQSSMG
ncbi:MAG: GNAT family N-acetyltransferase [Planctomycetes bacterium]|nr:GNAT family N-acetyltransferase [Planctomycetota bacterium]